MYLCSFEVLSSLSEGWRFGAWQNSICSFQYEWACKFGAAGAAEMWNCGWHAERPRHAGLIQTAFDVCLCVKWAGGPEFTQTHAAAHPYTGGVHAYTRVVIITPKKLEREWETPLVWTHESKHTAHITYCIAPKHWWKLNFTVSVSLKSNELFRN